MIDDLMVDRANLKDTVIDIGPRDASQVLLQQEQDDDDDEDDFVDICVTDTQQFSSIPSPFENTGEAPRTSGACSMDASSSSASTTFSISNQSGSVGEKIADSHNYDNYDDPKEKEIQEPDPSQPSSPPSPSPFHFPYTSDSVCATPVKTEKSLSRNNAIITSAEMVAESQSSCTEFSQRGVREKTPPLSQPGSVEPKFNEQDIAESEFYEQDIAESEQDIAESQISQVYQTSQQHASSGVAADASQTAQKIVAGDSALASLKEEGSYCCHLYHL